MNDIEQSEKSELQSMTIKKKVKEGKIKKPFIYIYKYIYKY